MLDVSLLFNIAGIVLLAAAAILAYFKNNPNKNFAAELNFVFPTDSFRHWKTLSKESPFIRKQTLDELYCLLSFLKSNRMKLHYRAYSQSLVLEHALVRFERNLNVDYCWTAKENIYILSKDELVKEFRHKDSYKKRLYLIPDYIEALRREAAELEKEYKAFKILLSNEFVFSIKY